MNQHLRSLIILAAIGAFSGGCLEHNLSIDVMPSYRVELSYNAKGDRPDFDDDRQLLPDSIRWATSVRVEESEDKTTQILEGHAETSLDSLPIILDWRRNPGDSLKIRRELAISERQTLFGTNWQFTGMIHSRRFKELCGDMWDFIPPECRALDSDSLKALLSTDEVDQLENKFATGVIQWNRERFLRRLDQVWHLLRATRQLQLDTTGAVYSIARSAWDEDIRRYMNNMDIHEPSVVNLDWWDDLRPRFLGHIADITGSDAVPQAIGIADALEREYQISKDIQDDMFRFRVRLPGWRRANNCMSRDADWLIWEFPGDSLMDDDRVMEATSFKISPIKAGGASFALVVVVLLAIVTLRHRGRKEKSDGDA